MALQRVSGWKTYRRRAAAAGTYISAGEGPSVAVCHPGEVGFESQQSKRPFKPAWRKLCHRRGGDSKRVRSEGDRCKTAVGREFQEAPCESAECLQREAGHRSKEVVVGRAGTSRPLASFPRSGALGIAQNTDLHGFHGNCHVRGDGAGRHASLVHVGGSPGDLCRAGQLRRRQPPHGSPFNHAGGPTFPADGDASHFKDGVCSLTACRPQVDCYQPRIPEGSGRHQREEPEVRQASSKASRQCSGRAGPEEEGLEEKEWQEGRRCGRRRRLADSRSGDFVAPSADAQMDGSVPLPDFVKSVDFGAFLLTTIFKSHTPLGNFSRDLLKQSFLDLPMMESNYCSSKQLWPCPVPLKLPRPSGRLSGRRRSRHRLHSAVREHLRAFVAACNWLTLGRPKVDTESRQPTSASQSRMLEQLESSLLLFYRLSPGPSGGLDRALGKFTTLQESLSHLTDATIAVRHSLDAYCRGRPRRSNFDYEDADVLDGVASGGTVAPRSKPNPSGTGMFLPKDAQPGSSAVPLDPDRIVFKHPPSFKAERFISDPLLKSGFMNPKHLRLPSQDWPSVRRAHVLCERDELFRLFAKWDSVGSLRLLDADQSEAKYRCGLFAVYKNHEKDRQILNPIPENGRTMNISDSTLSLSHGSLLTGLFLEDDQDLVIGADDLEDFYHCFIVAPEHAHRNHIHGVFNAERFVGWNCWDESLRGKKVVGCFSTLAMGTGFAVEVAQHVHSNLLKRKACLADAQWVQYRRPLPRGDTLQLLCIDDYAVLQKVPRGLRPCKSSGADAVHREDLRLLNRANHAYSSVALRSSEKKAVRDSFHTVILGGELDGRRGLVNAPRLRVLVLCKITLRLIRIGYCTKPLLETIVGCWIFILMFRRPLLCILSDVFHEGEDVKRGEIFKLSTGCIQELLLLVTFAPFAFTNLRAKPLPTVFCTDASLSGGGVCSADVSKETSLELCRSPEQRGFYTRVNGSTLGTYEALHGHDIAADHCPGVPKSLTEGFIWDFCEVFRGSGHLSAAHQSLGLCVHPGFEIRDGVEGDITNSSTILALKWG